MITRSPDEFLEELTRVSAGMASVASPRGVFMMEPTGFRVSSQTAQDNSYMDPSRETDEEKALWQFRDLVQEIRDVGVEVRVFPGNAATPDAMFLNNVFATVPGSLIIGSMRHPERRAEADRPDIIEWFEDRGYLVVDLREQPGIGELTGAMVIDRARKIGFCGMSGRVDDEGLAAMHEAFELKLTLAFDLVPSEYHTNVVMSVLAGRACVVHAESFGDPAVVKAIERAYPGKTLRLTQSEKQSFVGNCIALTGTDLFMSRAAWDALRPSSRSLLQSWDFNIHHVDLSEIEKAGGSLRCMVAEIF